MLKQIPKEYHDAQKGTLKLLWEEEWRALGITQVRELLLQELGSHTDNVVAESRMGALRSTRARATHPLIQVSCDPIYHSIF